MRPDASVLRGVSYDTAVNFGMPHIQAFYRGKNVNTNALETDAECSVCGRMASNSHHEPPKGTGGKHAAFTLFSEWGVFSLRPALIAVCGSGTTGCHGMRHGGQLSFRWVWDDEDAEELWWSGYLLAHGYVPHDERLYEFGHWEISRKGVVVRELRQ